MTAEEAISRLRELGLTLAVAESLTGGLLLAEFVAVPGASEVLRGGVVAYATPLKSSLLGVDAELLDAEGAVHPEVARQMASNVRAVCAVDGVAVSVGLATTGVAGPGAQDGKQPGTAYIAVAAGAVTAVEALRLSGTRAEIRAAVVSATIGLLERTELSDSQG